MFWGSLKEGELAMGAKEFNSLACDLRHEMISTELKDHENRMRLIEKETWKKSGIIGVVSGIISAGAVILAAILRSI